MEILRLALYLACVLLVENWCCCGGALLGGNDVMKNTRDLKIDSDEPAVQSMFSNSKIPYFVEKFSGNSEPTIEAYPYKNRLSVANQQLKKNYFGKKKSIVMKAIANVRVSKNIDEMIKRIESFPTQILNEKPAQPLLRKFENEFSSVAVNGRKVLRMARKLEKSGQNKTKKEAVEFNVKLKELKKLIKKFAKNFNSESEKQRNKNLKIVKDHPNDINQVKNAKNAMNIIDVLKDMIKTLQAIPDKIKCIIEGHCNDSHEENNSEDNNSGDDEQDEHEETEEYDDDY